MSKARHFLQITAKHYDCPFLTVFAFEVRERNP